MSRYYDAIIIGGGAAGLAAAAVLGEQAPGARVALLEKNDRVGKKLLTTGNGRCNLTNACGLAGRYHGDSDFAAAAFRQFGFGETLAFLHGIGILTTELENGKLFPLSLQANAVVDQLRFAVEERGVELICGCDVSAVHYDELFRVETPQGTLSAKKVLITCGGKTAPNTGSDGSGFELLEAFGHRCTRTFPAIVQVTVEAGKTKPLAGIKVEGCITAAAGGKTRTESGEILFTDYGLSGPPVLQISRLIARNGGGTLTLDLLPALEEKALAAELRSRKENFGGRECGNLLVGILQKRLGQVVLKTHGISLAAPCASLSDREIFAVARGIKSFSLKATGTKGWNMAQVTAGGIDTIDFDAATMQSRLYDGLFVAGEVLNVDGDCGGFNLQWAWTSGILAAKAMAADLESEIKRKTTII